MSIPVTELKPGDRVVLFCPGSRRERRVAVYEGTHSGSEVLAGADQVVQGAFNVDRSADYAMFVFETDLAGRRMLHGAIRVKGGLLEDDQGRPIHIEARVAMGVG